MSFLCIFISYLWGVPSMIANFLVFLFICKETPLYMKYYKFLLLHMVAYNFQMSFFFSVMFQPEVLFPALGCKINGLGWWFAHWGYDVGPLLLGYTLDCGAQILVSLDLCITYRYCTLMFCKEYWKTPFFYFHIIILYSASWFAAWAVQQFHVPNEVFLTDAMRTGKYDAILPYIENDPEAQFFGYLLEKPEWYLSLTAFIALGFGYLVVKNLLLLHRLMLQFETHKLSTSTARMHRKLTILVAMQIMYPFVCFSVPVAFFTVSAFMDWDLIYSSKLFHWVVESLICSLPLFNGVTTLYFVAPYREAFLRLIGSVDYRRPLFRLAIVSNENKSSSTQPITIDDQNKSS